ncbi:universal stress protein [Thermodesulfobacteriota bacterium B35]
MVPVDGSRFSMKAVELASRLALIHEAEVRLVHVVDSVVMHQLCRFSDEPYEKVHENMAQSGNAFLEDMAGRSAPGRGPGIHGAQGGHPATRSSSGKAKNGGRT